jgi:hypothetical protein
MQATQNYSNQKSNGYAVSKNTALPDFKKVNSQTNSNNGKLKPTANLKEEHQRSRNQKMIFPESDHQKNLKKFNLMILLRPLLAIHIAQIQSLMPTQIKIIF